MTLGRYLLVRTLWAALGFLVALAFVFLAFRVALPAPSRSEPPRSPATSVPPDQLAEYFDREESLVARYGEFVSQVASGSLGQRFEDGDAVGPIVARSALVTLSVLLGAFIVVLALAGPLALWSSRRPRATVFVRRLGYIAFGVPSFLVGILLAYYVGFRIGLTPVGGYCDAVSPTADCGGLGDWASHLVLPSIALALGYVAIYARVLRTTLVRMSKEPEARPRRKVGLTLVRLVGAEFGFALGLTVLVEIVFGLPGLGNELITALDTFEYQVAEGVLIFAALLALTFHLVVDLFVGWMEPELRWAKTQPRRQLVVRQDPAPPRPIRHQEAR